MVVGRARSGDMRRTVGLSARRRRQKPDFYHRPAASCTSVERDLHSPKARVRVTGESDMTIDSEDHENASYGTHTPAFDFPAGVLAR